MMMMMMMMMRLRLALLLQPHQIRIVVESCLDNDHPKEEGEEGSEHTKQVEDAWATSPYSNLKYGLQEPRIQRELPHETDDSDRHSNVLQALGNHTACLSLVWTQSNPIGKREQSRTTCNAGFTS